MLYSFSERVFIMTKYEMLLATPTDDIDCAFKWKDQRNNCHAPTDMETRHIFFTLRMIWNHAVPKDMQIKPFKRYRFTSFYTNEYIVKAIRALTAELFKRDDLTPYFKKNLAIIQGHLLSQRAQKAVPPA